MTRSATDEVAPDFGLGFYYRAVLYSLRGNADRGVVMAFDEGRTFDPAEPDPGLKASAWDAGRISRVPCTT